MENQTFMSGLMKINYSISLIQDIITKLKILESVEREKSHLTNNFIIKMNMIVNLIKTYFNIRLTNEELGNFVINWNNSYSELVNFLNLNSVNNTKNILITQKDNDNNFENLKLKNLYLEALNKKDHKRHFQVYYVFKNKIKRMYRIDCMTRKINVNFYHYLRDNYHSLNINDEFLDFFRSNIRFTSREKFQELNKKYPQFTDIYNSYLESSWFKKLISIIKKRYDKDYQNLFFRHSINFLNFFLKENDLDSVTKKTLKKERLSLRKLSN